MHVWIVVVALLALAVFFLFISLFLKDNQYEDELDELSEGLLELNREVYSLKKKIQELEGTPIYRAPVEHTPQPEPEFTFIPQPVVEPEPTFTPRFEEKEEEILAQKNVGDVVLEVKNIKKYYYPKKQWFKPLGEP